MVTRPGAQGDASGATFLSDELAPSALSTSEGRDLATTLRLSLGTGCSNPNRFEHGIDLGVTCTSNWFA